MLEYLPRLFDNDESVIQLGEQFLGLVLSKDQWTHEAHLATCAWIILSRPEIDPGRDLPTLIRRYNEAVGGVNSDSEGYHETITQTSIRAVRLALARSEGEGLANRVNRLIEAPEGKRDWALRFYSPECLFSNAARKTWIEPDRSSIGD